jgi:hypothetical protein
LDLAPQLALARRHARSLGIGAWVHKLAYINKVLQSLPNRNGGFTNLVVVP